MKNTPITKDTKSSAKAKNSHDQGTDGTAGTDESSTAHLSSATATTCKPRKETTVDRILAAEKQIAELQAEIASKLESRKAQEQLEEREEEEQKRQHQLADEPQRPSSVRA